MNKISLSYKLNISILILFIFILTVAIYSVLMINKTQSYSVETETNWLPSIISAQKMQKSFSSISRRPLRIILDNNENDKEEGIKILNTAIEKFLKDKKQYETYINEPSEVKADETITLAWKEFSAIIDETIKLSKLGKNEDAYSMFNKKGRPFQVTIEDSINRITEINNNGAIESTKKGKNLTYITTITMVCIVFAAIIVLFTIMDIVKTTTKLIEVSIGELKKQSSSMNKIGMQLKEGALLLTKSVAEQAASVHETSAAINEITSMVNRTSENSKESSNIAKNSSSMAEEGQKIMSDLVTSMETIQESNAQLQNISGIINQIQTKTAVIGVLSATMAFG